MELRHLRYFVAVAQEENVSRAALKLHISQPALSRQVRDLEDELGFRLFQRTAKSLKLTSAGSVFLIEARAVIQRAEAAVQAARSVATGGGGEIHVGYAPSLTARLLPPTLRAFHAELPRVSVKLHDFSTEEMLAGLRTGELQLAFLARPDPASLRGLRFEELARDPLRVAISRKHPLARRRSITLTEVAREPVLIYSRKHYPEYFEFLSGLLSGAGGKPQIAGEHDSVNSLIAAVEAGAGAAIVSEAIGCLSGPRLKLIPLSPSPDPIIVGVAWTKGALQSAAERLRDTARTVAKDALTKPERFS